MTDTTKTIAPVAVQAYHVSDSFSAGTYRLIEGAPDKKIYITTIQISVDTAPIRIEDSSGRLLLNVNGNSLGGSGGITTAVGADVNVVFTNETTNLDLYMTAFIA
jgi:hypothetical protein